MERLRPAWLLTLPLLAVAWLSAHALAYEVLPAPQHGHGYLDWAPLLLTLCATAAVVALAARLGGRRRGPLARWPACLLPFVGFAVQEHLERGLALSALPLETAFEPVFLLGLALQLPFAVAAFLVARALEAVADAVGARPSAGSPAPAPPEPPPTPGSAAPPPALARGWAGRAPPLPA